MTVAPPVEIRARIQQIESRFAPPSALPSKEADSAFASTLLAAMGDGGDTAALEQLLGASAAPDGPSVHIPRPSGPTGDDVVETGMKYLGVPYLWGGTDPHVGLDCSGFVQRVYGDLGIELPRVSRDQARQGAEVASLDQAKPGDLISFGNPVDHIAIYVGDGKIIQAPSAGDVVKVSPISREITSIRRIIPETAPAGDVVDPFRAGYLGHVASTASPAVGKAAPYLSMFRAAGERHGVDPALLAAVAQTESAFNPNAVSGAGARGLMQFMPATARDVGIDPLDPAQAIDGGARYLKTQLRKFGSVELALAAYNAGPGAVSRYGGVPPYSETRSYVTKVTSAMNETRTWFGGTR